ncbi:MAG TPA: hypothetical protein VLQ80_21430 [Candidatus Saccharimonadia bacterium]|nr:hypothetical protein [Candidatus Saccharimonadia bacterium]
MPRQPLLPRVLLWRWLTRHKYQVQQRIGRQKFDDDREWLFDEDLDGVRVWYRWSALTFRRRWDIAPRVVAHSVARWACETFARTAHLW